MTNEQITATLREAFTTPEQFRAWLQTDVAQQCEFECRNPHKCAIAQFVRSKLPQQYEITVTSESVTVYPRPRLPGTTAALAYIFTPEWAYEFIDKFDSVADSIYGVLICKATLALLNELFPAPTA